MKKRNFNITLSAVYLGLGMLIAPKAAVAGNMGFINSTDTELRFVIDITGPNYKEDVDAHTDTRETKLNCTNNDGLKNFEISVKKRIKGNILFHKWEQIELHYNTEDGKKHVTKTVHRKCGEVLWITHKNNHEYWIKHAPNVEANHLPSQYRHLNDDTNDYHMTFVNQTGSEMIFKISSESNPISVVGDRSVEPYFAERQDCGPGKKYAITVDRKQSGSNPEVHDKFIAQCGDTIYLYKDGDYKISFEKDWESPPNNAPYVYRSESFDVNNINACQSYQEGVPTVLFAHGYNDGPLVWDTFAIKADKMDWRVLRTVVAKEGSIKKRAHMLNAYIMKVDEKCGIPDGSLRVIGHSMGGLDLRYLVHYRLPAAKKIENVYTLATPHQGTNSANFWSGDAINNLKPAFMEEFNYWNPYMDEQKALSDMGEPSQRFSIDNRQIYLCAIRFNCDGNDNAGDGVVGWKKQKYGTHFTPENSLREGKHAASGTAFACTAEVETEQENVLKYILNHEGEESESCK